MLEQAKTLSIVPLEGNETATSIAIGQFAASPESVNYCVIGAVKNYQLNPKVSYARRILLSRNQIDFAAIQ